MSHALIPTAQVIPPPKPKLLSKRRILIGCVTLCGMAMLVILLSDPRVLGQRITNAKNTAAGYGSPQPVLNGNVTVRFAIPPRRISRASGSRVRVRRAGIITND